MLNFIVTILTIGLAFGLTYFLGLSQGRHLERTRRHERERQSEWVCREALLRFSPWTKSAAEWHAQLANEYRAKKEES